MTIENARQMKTVIETITPETAKEYLSHNISNRPIRSRDVDKMVRDIKEGNWRLTHQGIAFDEEGNLVDGQHRLTAIALSGAAVMMMVTRGLPISQLDAVDTGLKRSFEDSLKFDQEAFEDPALRNKGSTATIRQLVKQGYNGAIILSNAELKHLMLELKPQIDCIYKASITRTPEPAAVRAAAVAALLCGESEEDIFDYFSVFSQGSINESGDKNIAAAFNWKKQIIEAKLRKAAINASKTYIGTQNSIWNYINGKNSTFVRAGKNARYPVDKLISALLKNKGE